MDEKERLIQESESQEATPVAESPESVPQEAADNGLKMENMPPRLEEGRILNGRVVLVQDDVAYVDVGWKSDLPVPLAELTGKKLSSAREVVTEGDTIKVMVIKSADEDKIQLSKRRADEVLLWEEMERAFHEKEKVRGKITAVIKGGLEVKIKGFRAFLPASQADLNYISDLHTLEGLETDLYIIELTAQRRRLVVSRRAVLEEEKAKAEEKVFNELKEGERRTGTVTRLTSFGAFVDIGEGVEGLLHISEISWDRLDHPSQRLQEGDRIEVLITKVDPETKRISLSLKQITPQPWETVTDRFQEGQIVEGEVVRLTPFGAFVHLSEGIDGLIHISQLSDTRVNKPEDVVQVGKKVRVKVLKVDPKEKRIGLSLKEVQEKKEPAAVDRESAIPAELTEDKPLSSNLGQILAEKMSGRAEE